MRKNVIELTESEFMSIVKDASKQVIQEINGKLYGHLSNGSLAARNDIENGIVDKTVGTVQRKVNNYDKLKQAKELDKRILGDLVSKYEGVMFQFLGTNRTVIDEPFLFKLTSVNKVDRNSFVFGGTIIWDEKQFNGNVTYNVGNGVCYYSNPRIGIYKYALTPVPPTRDAWNELIQFFLDALTTRKR